MSRVWLIGWHHFRQEVSKRSFLLVLLSLPLFLTLTIGLGALSVRLSKRILLGSGISAGMPKPRNCSKKTCC